MGKEFENIPPTEEPKKPKYTLEDLERERQWDSGFGPNNPGAERRKLRQHFERLDEIEAYLKNEGVLEFTEEEKMTQELDALYPNAKSKTIVEHNGKKYQSRYFPLDVSNSGKTVYEWGHTWKLLEENPK